MDQSELEAILASPTVGVVVAGRVLGIGRNSAYKACVAGDIPSIKIGGTYRVPTAKLRAMIGMMEKPSPPMEPVIRDILQLRSKPKRS